jgi:catechol 2,3-dioxygenase-like lactoylglutathione lyase family enzyme
VDWKLEVVVIPVSDVDRSKRFYGEQCGFNIDVDNKMGESMRVVQVTPPGSGCSISFGVGLAEMEPGSIKGLQLVVEDIQLARKELLERGVDVSEIRHVEESGWADGPGGDWNSFIFFDDPDGNSWAVQQKPSWAISNQA